MGMLCIELAQAYHNSIADFTETSEGSAGRLNEERERWERHGYSKRTPREHTGDASLSRSRRSWLWRRQAARGRRGATTLLLVMLLQQISRRMEDMKRINQDVLLRV